MVICLVMKFNMINLFKNIIKFIIIMKYLITGITGFAGPHLANVLLKEGHDVYGLVRGSNGMETDIMDIVDANDFDKITFLYSDLRNFRTLTNLFKKKIFNSSNINKNFLLNIYHN